MNVKAGSSCTHSYALNKAGAVEVFQEMQRSAVTEDFLPIDFRFNEILESSTHPITSYWRSR